MSSATSVLRLRALMASVLRGGMRERRSRCLLDAAHWACVHYLQLLRLQADKWQPVPDGIQLLCIF